MCFRYSITWKQRQVRGGPAGKSWAANEALQQPRCNNSSCRLHWAPSTSQGAFCAGAGRGVLLGVQPPSWGGFGVGCSFPLPQFCTRNPQQSTDSALGPPSCPSQTDTISQTIPNGWPCRAEEKVRAVTSTAKLSGLCEVRTIAIMSNLSSLSQKKGYQQLPR